MNEIEFRDWFAAQALTGLIPKDLINHINEEKEKKIEEIVKTAYLIADEMMEYRYRL